MKQNNSGTSLGFPAGLNCSSCTSKTNNERKPMGLLSRSKALLGFALLLSLQLLTGKAHATALTTTGFSCTLGMTATSTCVIGDFATFGTTSTNYWTYTVSTSGYSSIGMSFHTTSSSTGPTTALVYYNIGAGDVLVTSYSVNTSCATKAISLPSACDNIGSLTIKIKMSGGTGSGGTNRISADGGFTGAASTFCSGTPASGSITASSSAFCGSGSSALTLAPGSTGADLTFQWYDGSGAISGATNLVYTTPVISSTSSYSVVTACPTSGFSSTPATSTVTVNTLPSAGTITVSSGSIAPVLVVGSTATLSDNVAGGVWLSSHTAIGTIDPTSGIAGGITGGTTDISYLVSDPLTGCSNSVVTSVNVVWPNTLGLYAGHDGNSTGVIGIADETVSSLAATGFGSATLCTSGGLSGITVNTVNATYSPAGPHVSYTLTPNSGHALNVFEFHVSSRSSGTGPTKGRLAYKIGGGSWIDEGVDHILSTSGSCGANTNTWYWVPAAAITTTSSIEVGFFPYDPGSSSGTVQLQSLETIGNVSTDIPCSAAPIPGVLTPTVTTACVSGYYFGTFAGDAGVGISYNWEASTDGGATWTPISGASNIYYTSPVQVYSVTPNTEFHVVTTCASFGNNTSNVGTLNVGAPVGPITVASGTISPLDVSATATLSDATPGGIWTSQHFSVASVGSASGIVSGLIPGITEIRYTTAGFGLCTATTTVTVLEPNTIAAYLGTGGASTSTVSYPNDAVTAIGTTGFGTATACGEGGMSGLTNDGVTSYSSANANVYFTVTPDAGYQVNVTGFHVTLRRSNSGIQKVRLAYSTDGGTTWVDDGVDQAPDNMSCGVSTTESSWNTVSFTLPTGISTTGVMFALFPYDPIAPGGTVQVNAIDITGSINPETAPITGTTTVCLHGTSQLSDATPGGDWGSDNSAIADVDASGLVSGNSLGSTVIEYDVINEFGCESIATVTVTVVECEGKHANAAGVTNVTNGNVDVKVYPNPADQVLHIAASEVVNVSVISVDGKVVIDQKNAKEINVVALEPGLYLLKIFNADNSLIQTTRFTKN